MLFSFWVKAEKMPELPKELLINSNLKNAKTGKQPPNKKSTSDTIVEKYFSCSVTRQTDLVGLPSRTIAIQVSKNSAYWYENKTSYNLRVEELEYLVGDSKDGFILNRVDGQVDFLAGNTILHGVCKPIEKPVPLL